MLFSVCACAYVLYMCVYMCALHVFIHCMYVYMCILLCFSLRIKQYYFTVLAKLIISPLFDYINQFLSRLNY